LGERRWKRWKKERGRDEGREGGRWRKVKKGDEGETGKQIEGGR